MAVLADLDTATAADLTSLDEAGLKTLAAKVQTGRKVLAGLATRIVGEAKRREATGSGAAAEEVLDPDGDQSADETDKDTARAGLADPLPLAGGSASDGTAEGENSDHLARRTAGMSESELGGCSLTTARLPRTRNRAISRHRTRSRDRAISPQRRISRQRTSGRPVRLPQRR